jgi:hypothetical protein
LDNRGPRPRFFLPYPQSRETISRKGAGRYDAPMRVRVFPLRSRGRRVERPENNDGVPGDLRMYSQVHGSEMHMVARLCTRTERSSTDRELLPPLFSPELVAVGDRALLLRGFQSIDGAAYVQEWRCLLE